MAMSERFLGFFFVNPGFAREACDEIRRCLDGGMVGIKLYHQYRVCDPAQTAVMELAADRRVPVLMHAGHVMDSATRLRQPRLSDASHFLKASEMFPETRFIQGHIGGGGDWEWNLRVLEDRPPNVYIDISGSVVDAGIVRRTVDTLGVDKVLFATDGSMEEGVGKLLAAGLSDDEAEAVAGGTMRALLAERRA
jgi:predicted TIM-barrel fold metal-dependent hydrolase